MQAHRLFTVLEEGRPRWVVLAASELDAIAHGGALMAVACGCGAPADHLEGLEARAPTAPERHHFEEQSRQFAGPGSEARLAATPLPENLPPLH